MNEIDKNIQEMFQAAAETILNKDIDDAEFHLCESAILTSINYMKSKRTKKERENHKINHLCRQCGQWEIKGLKLTYMGICSNCGRRDDVIAN